MLTEFKRYISENKLICKGEKILVAVSGGIDSMVMAHLFLRAGIESGIAHCNFSLRGDESDMDEAFVRQFAIKEGIPFYTMRFDTPEYARTRGISIQMAARELRYNWFEETMTSQGFDKTAIAHNLNDNIETVIINLVRGTGIAGLSGIKPLSNRIIRPLLFATRNEIVAYSNRHGIGYREDMSNADTKYIRNKIRHKILPVLKEINPSIEETLNITAERFSGIGEMVTDYVTELRERISEERDEVTRFNIAMLKPYLHNKALIFELFRPYGITPVQLGDLLKVVTGSTGSQIMTVSHRILKNRRDLIITAEKNHDFTVLTAESLEELGALQYIESAAVSEVTSSFEIPSDPFTACIDADKVSFPVVIRRWRAGDYFYPLGMKNRKKLSDYFINNKYSILEKENMMIMEIHGKIAWIIGSRLDNRFRITRSTKKALLIKAAKSDPKIIPLR